MTEAETWMSQDDAYELGREDAVAVSQGELEAARYQRNPIYMQGFEEQSDEIAAEQGDDSIHRDPAHSYKDDDVSVAVDDDFRSHRFESKKGNKRKTKTKITKTQLAQIIKEEILALKEITAMTGDGGAWSHDSSMPTGGAHDMSGPDITRSIHQLNQLASTLDKDQLGLLSTQIDSWVSKFENLGPVEDVPEDDVDPLVLRGPSEDPLGASAVRKRRTMGIGGSVHDRLGGPRESKKAPRKKV
jgi:hypothetical protein